MYDLLKSLGLEVPTFLAGSSGAVVFLTKNNKMSTAQRFLTILSGGLTANYITPLVANWLCLDTNVLYGIAFLLGFSGMKSVELVLNIFFTKIKKSDNDTDI